MWPASVWGQTVHRVSPFGGSFVSSSSAGLAYCYQYTRRRAFFLPAPARDYGRWEGGGKETDAKWRIPGWLPVVPVADRAILHGPRAEDGRECRGKDNGDCCTVAPRHREPAPGRMAGVGAPRPGRAGDGGVPEWEAQ